MVEQRKDGYNNMINKKQPITYANKNYKPDPQPNDSLKLIFIGKTTKYTHRTIPKTRAFIQKCIKEDRTPFLEELALELGVSGKTLYNWAYPKDGIANEFTEIYDLLQTVQKLDIKRKALVGKYESPIAKLILSAEHNVVERIKKEVTGNEGEAIQVESKLSPEARKEYSDQITKIFEKIYSTK